MSIGLYIEGMEMPKRCGECPCFHAENPMYCQAVKADKNKKIIAPYGKPRPDWCPLALVPPHGSLIEVEPIVKFIIDGLNSGEFGYDQIKVLTEIQYAPTIIPAELSKEET